MKDNTLRQKKFFNKLLVCFLLIGELPLLLCAAAVLVYSHVSLLQTLQNSCVEGTDIIALRLEDTLKSCESLTATLAKSPFFTNSADMVSTAVQAQIYANLYLATAGKPSMEINVLAMDGSWAFSTKPLPDSYNPVKYSHWGIFRAAKTVLSGQPAIFVHDTRYSENQGRSLSLTLMPNSSVIFIIDIYRSYFVELVKTARLPANLLAYIYDEYGIPLFVTGEDLKKETLALILAKNSTKKVTANEHFAPFVFASYTIEKYGLSVITAAAAAQTLHSLRLVTTGFIVLCLINAVLCFFVAFRAAKNISQPIYALTDCIKKLQAGDFKAKTTLSDTNDEFFLLSQTINSMGDKIEQLLETNRQKERGLKTAEIKTLQAQIHPHFIFNCLEVIRQSIKMDKKSDAIHMITRLGTLLRGSLNGAELITVGEEEAIIRSYLELQTFRYADRLSVEICIDENLKTTPIPKFTLQPIVENAVMHGMSKNLQTTHICITGLHKNESVVFTVSDNGKGISKDEAALILSETHTGHGLGMYNVHKRLQLYYGTESGIQIETAKKGGALITLILKDKITE